jgi:ketosteroid isomerase-like protein
MMNEERLNKALEALEVLLHKEAIREQIYKWCRAADRNDKELMRQIYHPDAIDEHGDVFKGPASEFIELNMADKVKGMKVPHHLIGNILIELDGNVAKVESYCCDFLTFEEADGNYDMLGWGRYLDRFELRNGEWKIAHRITVVDGGRYSKANIDWDEGLFAAFRPFGTRDKNDPLWRFLA